MFLKISCIVVLAAIASGEDLIFPPADSLYANQSFGLTNLDLGGRSLLFERQQRCVDPGYVPCANIPTKCCPPTDNCRIDLQKCCPQIAETCQGKGCWEPGAECCSAGHACQAGEGCCLTGCCQGGATCCAQASNCCAVGAVCCPGTCCPSGSTCGTQYGYCQRKVPTTTPRPTTTSARPTTTTPRPTTTASLPKIKTPKESSTTTTSSTEECPTPAPSPTGEALANLPVVEFLFYPSDYEFLNDIVLSVCLGFQSRGVQGNFDVLTRAEGSGKCYRQRRRAGNCEGCCTGVFKDSGIFKTAPGGGSQNTNCDEYPFASTAEGGAGAHRSCVVDWQNTFQGNELKRFYASSGVKVGDSFGVRVVGVDCDTVREEDLQGCNANTRVKRQSEAGVLKEGTSNFVIPAANGTGALNALVIPFGDLKSGKYASFAKLLEGEVDELSIVSNSGNALNTALSLAELATEGQDLDFELEEGEYGVGIIALTKRDTMNMSYVFSSEDENSTTTTPAPAATSKSSAERHTVGFGFVWVFISLVSTPVHL